MSTAAVIVVDVETTGLDPRKHAIVSIGALEFEKPTNQFYGECGIEAKTAVDAAALKVNGFTIEQITHVDMPLPKSLADDFIKWVKPIKDKTLGGHNTGFDVAMLRSAFKNAKLKWPFGFRNIDLHGLAYTHMKSARYKIPLMHDVSALSANTVHEYVGLGREPDPHHGLMGAKMEAEAMSRLMFGKPLLKEFKHLKVPKRLLR